MSGTHVNNPSDMAKSISTETGTVGLDRVEWKPPEKQDKLITVRAMKQYAKNPPTKTLC